MGNMALGVSAMSFHSRNVSAAEEFCADKERRHNCKGVARAIRRLLDAAEHPLTAIEIATALCRENDGYTFFSVVSVVERLDERRQLVVLRLANRGGGIGYTLPGKLEGYKRAGMLGEINVWPVPDLRAILEDIGDEWG